MKSYKYMAYSGLCEYMVVSKTKPALVKICKAYARADYEHYVETCEYIDEPADELELKDFDMVEFIEAYDEGWIDYLMKSNDLSIVYEVDRNGSLIRNGMY